MRKLYAKAPKTTGMVLLALLALSGNALASSVLYAATPYNVFVLNNFTASNSDVQGGLAAKGNITISSYSVASDLTAAEASSDFPAGYTLVAGGLLTASSGTLFAGGAYGYTTNVTPNAFTVDSGTVTTGSTSGGYQVIDFSQAAQQLDSLSTSLAGKATTAGDSCTLSYSTTTCKVTGDNLNIINVSDPSIFAGKTINIVSTGKNVTLVINVAGTSDSLGGAGFTVFDNGVTVLFNYYQATTLSLGSSAFTASLLAPLATVTGSSGNFDGTLIAMNFSGQMEFHDSDLFSGNLTSAPEPMSMVLAGAGLLGLGLIGRKRAARRSAVRA